MPQFLKVSQSKLLKVSLWTAFANFFEIFERFETPTKIYNDEARFYNEQL